MYDVTRRDSFSHLTNWLNDASEFGNPDMSVMLVGNKCDLDSRRVVSTEEGMKFAKDHNILFMEVSAKTEHNVDSAFEETARHIYGKIQQGVFDLNSDTCGVRLGASALASPSANPQRQSKSSCC